MCSWCTTRVVRLTRSRDVVVGLGMVVVVTVSRPVPREVAVSSARPLMIRHPMQLLLQANEARVLNSFVPNFELPFLQAEVAFLELIRARQA